MNRAAAHKHANAKKPPEDLTVHQVARLAGVSVRTLQYYDNIGLLSPSTRTDAGYRLYAAQDLAQLQQIMLFRELEFPLKEIKAIIESPRFNKQQALEQQVELLKLKRDRLDGLIAFAERTIEEIDGDTGKEGAMGNDFRAFDNAQLDEYKQKAREAWGATDEWREYEARSEGRTAKDDALLGARMMDLFIPFGEMATAGVDPTAPEAQEQARVVQRFISENFYQCSNEVFAQLGKAYGAGGAFTQNINAAAGAGAAEYAARAIAAYCG